MGMFDTFIDDKRNRITQCKAFGSNLLTYRVGDKVKESPISARLYYVKSEVPFRYIEIYDGTFMGIFDINEMDYLSFTSYPLLDYIGKEFTENYEYVKDLSDLWMLFKSGCDSDLLPYTYKKLYKYEVLGEKVQW